MTGTAVGRVLWVLGLLALWGGLSPAWALPVEEAEQMGRDAVALHAGGDLRGAEQTLNQAFKVLGEGGRKPGPRDRGENWQRHVRLYLLRELADLRLTQGRPAEAQALLSDASALALGNSAEEAHVLNQKGLVDWRGGNLAVAEREFSQAKTRYDRLGPDHDLNKAMVRGNLGLILLDRFTAGGPAADLRRAESLFSEALATFQAQGEKDGMANQWGNLGLVYLNQNRLDEAEQAQKKALVLCQEIGDQIGEVDALGSLGRVAEEKGEGKVAADLYRQAFDLSKDVGYARGIAHHGLYLASLFLEQGDAVRAEAYGLPALAQAQEIGNALTTSLLLDLMTQAAIAQGDCTAARSRYQALSGFDGTLGERRARLSARRLADPVRRCRP